MFGLNGNLDIGQVEDLQMINDKLIDGKELELQVGLKINQLDDQRC